jgi:hypothetical protein
MKKQFFVFLIFSWPFVTLNAQDLVERQVLRIGLALASEGYELTHDIKYASLYDGRTDDYYFTLDQGHTYQIYAVCDGDCEDLDLCIYDSNNNEIECDESSDDLPIVSVSPKWTGRFRLWVKMYDCTINPCKFGIAIFGR